VEIGDQKHRGLAPVPAPARQPQEGLIASAGIVLLFATYQPVRMLRLHRLPRADARVDGGNDGKEGNDRSVPLNNNCVEIQPTQG